MLAASGVQAAPAAEYQRVAASQYVAAARLALEESLSARSVAVEVEPDGTHRDLRVLAGGVELRTRVPHGAPGSRAVVWVDVVIDGRLRASERVVFGLRRWERVLVAKEAVAAGTPLVEQQFELRMADVARIGDAAMKDIAALAGKRSRRALNAGAVLDIRDLQDVPAVQAGERIAVYARSGRVVVRTTAVAQRDAFTGDVIEARLPNTGEHLRAHVTGNHTAWISENETTIAF
jgi:flagella basal body P-ring formation protein FlgA